MKVRKFRIGILTKILGVAIVPVVILLLAVGVVSHSIHTSTAYMRQVVQTDEMLMANTEKMALGIYQWDDDLDAAVTALQLHQKSKLRLQIKAAENEKNSVYSAFSRAITSGLDSADVNYLKKQLQTYSAYSNRMIALIQADQNANVKRIQMLKNASFYHLFSQSLSNINTHYNVLFQEKMTTLDQSFTYLRLTVYSAIAIGIGISFAVAIYMARSMVRQLRRLVINLERVAKGERILEGFERTSNDEFGDAAEALYRTVSALSSVEQDLKDELEFRTSLLGAIPVPVLLVNLNGRLMGVNAAFEQFYGRTQQELMGKYAVEVVNPEMVRMLYDEDKESSGVIIQEIQDKDTSGNVRDLLVHKANFHRTDGTVAGEISILMDITEQKRSERKIQENNERMRNELELAESLQRAFLPNGFPNVPGVNLTWKYLPSSYLAGDMFNVMLLDDHHLGFYILDVMGHGVSAALNAIAINYFIRPVGNNSELMMDDYRLYHPAGVLNYVNQKFGDYFLTESFFTIFYGVLDLTTLKMVYARGGHPAPVLLHENGTSEYLDEGDMPLGLIKKATFQEFTKQLERGDKLILYTDGLTEVINPEKELFTVGRLTELLRAYKELPIDQLIHVVLTAAENYSSGSQLNDDVTVIGMELTR